MYMQKGGDGMSGAKTVVMQNLQKVSDDISDEMEVVSRLYALVQLEHSIKRCEEEGSISDEDLDEHFRKKMEEYAS